LLEHEHTHHVKTIRNDFAWARTEFNVEIRGLVFIRTAHDIIHNPKKKKKGTNAKRGIMIALNFTTTSQIFVEL